MFGKYKKNKNFLSLVLSFGIFCIVFFSSSFFYSFNKNIQNFYYTLRDELFEKKANKNIVVVEIDEKTLKNLGRFPFERTFYIPVIENLKKAKVGVIGFDIIFADKTETPIDNSLALAFSQAGNVVIGNAILDNGQVEELLPLFSNNVLKEGFFPPLIDVRNNTVYSLEPFFKRANRYYEHFSLALLESFYNYSREKREYTPKYDNKFYYGGNSIKIPFSQEGKKEVLINFINSHKFQRFSFYDMYDTESFKTLQKSFDFKDKIVIIGTATKGIKDVFMTPNGIEYGVYIHANFLNTILNRDYLIYFNNTLEWILIFCLIILSVYFNLSRSSYILIWSNIAIIVIFLLILPIIIIGFTNIIINHPSEILFALFVSLSSSNITKYIIENKEKIKLNKALSEYVSKDIAQEIISGEGLVNLDGAEKNIAILFSDIEGFTTMSEDFSPQELVAFLREYLQVMSDIIIEQRGFINKYEGDAIMALWGSFGYEDTMLEDACNTALLQISSLKELNKIWQEREISPVNIRIGIHTGKAILGNIGAKGKKLEFTALGDSVNLASRLEGVNKYYGTNICVSEDVFEGVKNIYEFRFLDKIRVKGKKIAINIYELLARKGEISKEKREIIEIFQTGLDFYFSFNFKKAKTIFTRLLKLGDKPSEEYVKRCDFFIKNPPPPDWDKVWQMINK
ncbi:adenylate/guanylate cyclase domain-containing protein [Candidatus Gracilibacteria bacterium]|nr:adenylate/guanylate cyclase domain-containing protein [Candidatus Gracilibacteria bacterium]NUJ98659.1 adenylate/guanylate cyclase domain-containing protein [Candidatus Gracilibacteria bacterium]